MSWTRRRFLSTVSSAAAAGALAPAETLTQTFKMPHLRGKKAAPAPAPIGFVYFGTDTDKHVSKGIYRAHFNATTGQLTPADLVAQCLRPSFLDVVAVASGQRRLYAVNAVADPSATVSAYLIDPKTGALTGINQVTSAGAGPCYVSVDATGMTAFVANYVGSSIATYRVEANGALSQPIERIDFKDPKFGKRGPHPNQDVPHPHSVHLSPDNRFLLVSDLGSDEISVFPVHTESSKLGVPALFSNARPGSGPRHIAFHPNGRWLYSVNELDSTVDQFLWSTTSSATHPQGLLVKAGPPVKTILPGFPVRRNAAAEVQVAPDGRYVYVSNRGDDSLVVFMVAPTDGALTLIQRISSGGRTPRHFTLDPTGNWILCGNQDSAHVAVFKRDPASGRMSGPTQTIPLDSVMFTLFA